MYSRMRNRCCTAKSVHTLSRRADACCSFPLHLSSFCSPELVEDVLPGHDPRPALRALLQPRQPLAGGVLAGVLPPVELTRRRETCDKPERGRAEPRQRQGWRTAVRACVRRVRACVRAARACDADRRCRWFGRTVRSPVVRTEGKHRTEGKEREGKAILGRRTGREKGCDIYKVWINTTFRRLSCNCKPSRGDAQSEGVDGASSKGCRLPFAVCRLFNCLSRARKFSPARRNPHFYSS